MSIAKDLWRYAKDDWTAKEPGPRIIRRALLVSMAVQAVGMVGISGVVSYEVTRSITAALGDRVPHQPTINRLPRLNCD